MANIQIPNLTPAIALNGTEQIEAVQAGTSVRITTQQISDLSQSVGLQWGSENFDFKSSTPASPISESSVFFGALNQSDVNPSLFSLTTLVQGVLNSNEFSVSTIEPDSVVSSSYQAKSTIVVSEVGTTKILSDSDNGKVLYFTNSSPISVETAAGLGAGFSCTIIQAGTGQISVDEGSGTTRVSSDSRYKSWGQWAFVTIFSPEDNVFVLGGNTTI